MKQSRAFSLTELMVALTLSLMLIAGLVHFYSAQRAASQLQNAMAESQMQAQIAMRILTEAIKKAGFIGCRHVSDDFTIANHTAQTGVHLGPDSVIRAKQSSSNTTLSVFYVDEIGDVLANMEDGHALWLTPYPILKKEAVFVLSDCEHADIVRAQSISIHDNKQHITFAPQSRAQYHIFDTAGRLYREQFFVGPTAERYPNGDIVWALQVRHLTGRREVLVPGIRAMKLWFRTHANQQWQTADAMTRWRDVTAINIQLISEAFAPSVSHASYATMYRQGYYYDRWHTQVALNNH